MSTDTRLGFETLRVPVEQIYYNRNDDEIVFRGVLPSDYSGDVYEVGLWSDESDEIAGEYGSRLLTDFDEDTEEWSLGSWTATNARVGTGGLSLTNETSTLTELDFDITENLEDTLMIAGHFSANTNFNIRLGSDTGYYNYLCTPGGTGYRFISKAMSSYTVSGTPDPTALNYISIVVPIGLTATMDAIRLEDTFRATQNIDYALITHDASATPLFNKKDGIESIIEAGISL